VDAETHSSRSESDDTILSFFPTVYSHGDVIGDKENVSDTSWIFFSAFFYENLNKIFHNIVNTYYFLILYEKIFDH